MTHMTNQIKIHINLVSLNFFKELTFTDVFVSPLNMWRKHLFLNKNPMCL